MNKKILVTGSEGYIGSVLVAFLISEGYEVSGLDTCFYSEGNLTGEDRVCYDLTVKDIRSVESADLEGFDAVVHLAALSNDPLGKLDPSVTYDINCNGAVRVAEFAKRAGVERFIFASSCSLYGQSDRVLTEESESNPQTAYGRSKIMAERELSKLADESFSPVFMRNATAFGISPRMRFDIVVNNLAGFAKTTGQIMILGDGTPWRPLVHVGDISRACGAILKADREAIHNQAFNVGDNGENYQIRTIAEYVQKSFAGCSISIAQDDAGDSRNYAVSFDKINERLGFQIATPLAEGIESIREVYERIDLDREVFEHRLYTRLKQIEWLMSNDMLSEDLHLRSVEVDL